MGEKKKKKNWCDAYNPLSNVCLEGGISNEQLFCLSEFFLELLSEAGRMNIFSKNNMNKGKIHRKEILAFTTEPLYLPCNLSLKKLKLFKHYYSQTC